MSSTNSVLGGT